MKPLVCFFSLLATTSSFALHVQPGDSIKLIPAGSKIVFDEDLNIKPQTVDHHIGSVGHVSCYVKVKEISDQDRVIKAGTQIEIKFHGMRYPRFTTPENSKIETIYCSMPDSRADKMTVQEFTDAIKPRVKLVMSEPVEF